MFSTVSFLAVTAVSALHLIMVTGPLLWMPDPQSAIENDQRPDIRQPVITHASITADDTQHQQLQVITVITDEPVQGQQQQADDVPKVRVVKPATGKSAATGPRQIRVQLHQANKSDKVQAINNEQAELERRIQELRNELVQAISNNKNDEAAEIKQTLAALQKESKHLQQNLQSAKATASRIEVFEIEQHGDQPPMIKRISQQESNERREREMHEREMREREMHERVMHERRVNQERERPEMRLQERQAEQRGSREQDPDQVMRRVVALHQAAEKLDQGGLPDMAHNLHRQAEEMEQLFHRMMEERAHADRESHGRRDDRQPNARGPHSPEPPPNGPHHPEAVHHLAEQVERLRHEVRDLHAKLDRMLQMMEQAHGK